MINETYRFKGKITEVRIWKLARTSQKIKQNMHRRLQETESGLVAYWPLNEANSDTIYDKTSHANHGTIAAANWVQSELPLAAVKFHVELEVEQMMAKKPDKNSPQSIETAASKAPLSEKPA